MLGIALVLVTAFSTPAMGDGAPTRVSSLAAASWCFFASPQAIRVRGQTVTGYVDISGDIVVASLVHGVAVHSYILHSQLQVDDHDTPTFYERPDGRVIAFYSRHGAGDVIYRITRRPGDITAWGPELTVPNTRGPFGATYPNPVYVAAEHRLYLYFRGAGFEPTMAYSANQGRSWSRASEVIDPRTVAGPGDGGPRPDRPYTRFAVRSNRTYVAFTNASVGSRPTNVYFAVREAGKWFTAAGVALHVPMAPTRAMLVFDAVRRHLRSSVWDVQVDAQGRPVVVLVTFRDLTLDAYWYARWNGHSWHLHRLMQVGLPMSDTSSTYAPGVALDPADPSVVAIARMGHRIALSRTSDGGDTWRTDPLQGTQDGVRPVFVSGRPRTQTPEVLYLQGHYHSYFDFQTSVYDATDG